MATKQELMDVINRGNTPCIDVITQCYPNGCDLVLGKIIRYSMMESGKFTGSIERLAKEIGYSSKTVERKIKFLEAQGILVDDTPDLKNHTHTYWVNIPRLNEEITLFSDSKFDLPVIEIIYSDNSTQSESLSRQTNLRSRRTESLTDSVRESDEDSIVSNIEFKILQENLENSNTVSEGVPSSPPPTAAVENSFPFESIDISSRVEKAMSNGLSKKSKENLEQTYNLYSCKLIEEHFVTELLDRYGY
jgi:hypothetical protein